MTTSVLEHDVNAPGSLTKSEFDILSNKLDSVINQKFIDKSLTFSPSDVDTTSDLKGPDHKPTSIDLSIFGLHNPGDIKTFLLTPAGATIKYKIGLEKAAEKAREEERKLQIQEHIIEEQRKILLFHWLLSEEEKEAQAAQEELILLQNEQAIKNSGQDPHKNDSSISKETLHNTAKYETPIVALKQSEKSLREIEKKLQNERKVIEK
ncbi:MAG: hypothetical protein HYX60_07095, partial [Legionella longbeachae]|nr:hypothetical protein [Legionella longbeachae]